MKLDRPPTPSLWELRLAKERALSAIERLFTCLHVEHLVSPQMNEPDDCASEILIDVSEGREPSPASLRLFLASLNQPVQRIRFGTAIPPKRVLELELDDGWRYYPGAGFLWKNGTVRVINGAWRLDMTPARYAAESLLEYLQQTAICGVLHKTCKLPGCQLISVGGRGNKQFCSPEHRKEFWSYSNQREYLRQKQTENRKQKSRVQKLRKSKGGSHGRLSSRKNKG